MSLTMKKRRVTVVVPNTRLGRMKAQAIRTADVIGPMAGDARDVAASRIESGFRMVNVGNDLGHMRAALEEQLVAALGSGQRVDELSV